MRRKCSRNPPYCGLTAAPILFLSTCGVPYVQPLTLNSETAAAIVGTTICPWTPQIPGIVTKIVAIDYQSTGRFGTASVLVAPGIHVVTFGTYYSGGIGPYGDVGNLTFTASFEGGRSYELVSTASKLGWANVVHARAWIIDNYGTAVTAPSSIVLLGPRSIVP